MSSPISPMEAIEIVQKVVALYQKIRHDVPEQVENVGKRMQRLERYLLGLKELLDDKHRHVLATLRPSESRELRSIITEIREDSEQIYAILEKWENNVGPFGLQLRFGSVAQALFAVGSSPDKLEKLGQSIEQSKQDLRDFLQLLGYFGVNQLLLPIPSSQTSGKRRSPSPAPSFVAKKNVIFIDPHNMGRSVVAEAYMQLLREWTVRTGGLWPISNAHSAGIRVKSRSDCADTLQSLQPPIEMSFGNYLPVKMAMASLFDNHLFNYPYKADIEKKFKQHASRGINHDLFTQYDFIIVFVGREHESLSSLKQALVQKHGASIAPRGKGRVVLLGSYLAGRTENGRPKDIWDAPKGKDGQPDRGNWNATTSNIKMAIKAFLQNELGWSQPPRGATVS